jgi:hypothetical protein
VYVKWREADLNHRPSGYEPDELPDCSIPRRFSKDTIVGLRKAINLFFELSLIEGKRRIRGLLHYASLHRHRAILLIQRWI